jgi:hypothetical protein
VERATNQTYVAFLPYGDALDSGKRFLDQTVAYKPLRQSKKMNSFSYLTLVGVEPPLEEAGETGHEEPGHQGSDRQSLEGDF